MISNATQERRISLAALAVSGLALTLSGNVIAMNNSVNETVDRDVMSFTEALAGGDAAFTARARVEYADQSALETGEAHTLQTMLRYSTPYWQNVSGTLEFNGVTSIADSRHNPGAGVRPAKSTRTPIADAQGASINRAYMHLKGVEDTDITFGRQYIDLDNERFVSSYHWRQQPRTYDAIALTNHSVQDLEIFYGYVWQVNTEYANTDITTATRKHKTHLVNMSYDGLPYGQWTVYGYFLNDKDISLNSAETLGVRWNGDQDVSGINVMYGLEFADQHDRHDNMVDYSAQYWAANLAANFGSVSVLDNFTVGLGYEDIDGNQNNTNHQFRTSLADFHGQNGWAGRFETAHNDGLKDLSVSAAADYQGYHLTAVYHSFDRHSGSPRFGHEWDFDVTKKFWNRYTASLTAAGFNPSNEAGIYGVKKAWLTVAADFS